ncbi:MAG: alpha-E domain-containing protein [Coriobacteriales bacterium]
MGTFTLSKTNRLYWLGRYVERAYIAIELMEEAYDISIDGPAFDYAAYCAKLNIPADYESTESFLRSYLFDAQNPDSAASALNMAFDNAVVLRETVGSMTLSYIQLAKNVMDGASVSMAPMLDLQTVQDYLMAFKGCVDDFVQDENSRMDIKIGMSVEHIDMSLRLDYKTHELPVHFDRLFSRLRRSKIPRDGRQLQLLFDLVPCPYTRDNRQILLACIESLFPDA